MHLGTLLAHLQDDANASTALEVLGDIVLYAQITSMGERFDETPGSYTAGAVSRFAAAPDEQWLGLIAAMEHGDQPARAALAHMLTWALRQDEGALAGESCACSTENCDDP